MGKAKRPFDWSTAKRSHFLLRLAYVGTRYHGVAWQQPEMANTVENELFVALQRTCLVESRETCNFSRCGRTDKGVHAYGNYVALTLRELPGGPAEYVRILNRVLPADIRILQACQVGADFNARFNCTGRVYKYYFATGRYDIGRMRQAAQAFVGTHDFRNFCKADVEATSTFKRTISEVSFVERGPCTELTVVGNAFLWHQIRCMVAVLFLVGEGLEDESIIPKLLDVDRVPAKPIYDLAPEDGLVLYSASYPDLELQPDPQALLSFQAAQADMERKVAVLSCLAGELEASLHGAGTSSANAESATSKHKKLLARATEPSVEERKLKVMRLSNTAHGDDQEGSPHALAECAGGEE